MLAFALSTGSFALDLHYTYTTSSSCCYGQKGYRGVVEGKRNIPPPEKESRDIEVPRYNSSTYHLLLVCSVTCAELHLPYLSRQSHLSSLYLLHIYTTPLHQCTLFFLIPLLSAYEGWARDYPYPANPLSDQLSARFSFLASSLLPHPPPTSTHCSLLRFPSLILQKRCQSASKSETLVRSESTHTYCTRPASRNQSLFKPDRTRFSSKSGRPASQ